MAAPAASICANHPKRERVATCGTCGNALCRDCVVHTGVGIKCRTCTGEAAPAGGREGTRGGRPAWPERRGRPRWVVPAAVGGAVVLVAAVLVLRSGGGGGERPVDQPVDNDPSHSSVPVERKVDLVGGGNVHIGATLMLPPGGQPVAGVLIIPGFGDIDRDAVMATTTPDASADRLSQDLNYSRPGTPDKLLADLSNTFLAENMATLRYDKRGSGTSQLRADQPLNYDDLVADAKAGLDFLAQRVEIGSAPLAIAGDDQGGLIGLRLAASNPRVKAVMLVSTFARPLADVIGGDLVAGRGGVGAAGGAGGQAQSDQLHDVAAKLAAGQHVPAPADLIGNLRPLLPASQETYLRQIFGLDPVAEARAVKVPVRLVRGGKDTTVTQADTDLFQAALPAGSFSEQVIADADHNLGQAQIRGGAALGDIGSWLATAATR